MKCTRCKKDKDISCFSRKRNSKNIVAKTCNNCRESKAYLWVKENPDKANKAAMKFKELGKARDFLLKKKYGINHQVYLELFLLQKNKCAICSTEKPGGRGKHFHVDHNHTSKAIRGILCTNCNRGLGLFKDSPALLKRAMEYLSY